MSDPILPPGMAVRSGRDADDNPLLVDDRTITLPDGRTFTISTALSMRQADAYIALLQRQLALIRDAERARQPVLELLP